VIDGVVTALHRNRVDVRLHNGFVIRTVVAGKLTLRKICVLPGDGVTVEVTPYDTKGRIVYRHK
jgi:translation initiation factor IF-1